MAIRVEVFDLADEKQRQKYESILNRASDALSFIDIREKRIAHSEGYFYIYLEYKE